MMDNTPLPEITQEFSYDFIYSSLKDLPPCGRILCYQESLSLTLKKYVSQGYVILGLQIYPNFKIVEILYDLEQSPKKSSYSLIQPALKNIE